MNCGIIGAAFSLVIGIVIRMKIFRDCIENWRKVYWYDVIKTFQSLDFKNDKLIDNIENLETVEENTETKYTGNIIPEDI